jgi:hypothetical protein
MLARTLRTYGPFLVVVLAAGLLASPSANDFFQFWWAGHLVAIGRSPYDPAAWTAAIAYGPAAGAVAQNCVASDAAACLWIYPPWTAWMFAPSGALGPEAGIATQRIALLAALAGGVVLWARAARATDASVAPLLVAVAASAPFVRDIVTGHFEGLLLIGLFLLGTGLRDTGTWRIVAGTLLLALKPHLFLALAPLVVVWLVSRRAYRTLLVTAVALAALAVVGVASDPSAWPAVLGRSTAKQELGGATTWGFSAAIAGTGAPLVATILVAVAVVSAVLAWRWSRPPDRATVLVGAGSALSLAVAPYLQSYDLVLLCPAVAIALAALRRPAAVVAAAVVIGTTWLAYLLELSGDPRAFAGVLPAVMLAALALSVRQRLATTLRSA